MDRRWLAATIAWGLALVLGLLVFMMRDRYEASARIYVDTQTVLKPLMAGLAFQPDIDQQVRMLARTLISRPNVERLFQNPHRPGAARGQPVRPAAREAQGRHQGLPERLGQPLRHHLPRQRPGRAQRLVLALVSIFVESSADTKKRDSTEASRFIEEQIKDYEASWSTPKTA